MNIPHFKRSRIFIKKAFQLRFVLGVFVVILLSGLCSALLIYWFISDDLHAQMFSAHVNLEHTHDRLGLAIMIGNSIAIVAAGIVSMITVLYATHKIVGPIYRFEALCEQVGNGDFDAVALLREKDHFQELAQSFTDMTAKLREQRERRLQLLSEIKRQIDIGKTNGDLSEQQALNTVLETLITELEASER